jgi:hypothetical protein
VNIDPITFKVRVSDKKFEKKQSPNVTTCLDRNGNLDVLKWKEACAAAVRFNFDVVHEWAKHVESLPWEKIDDPEELAVLWHLSELSEGFEQYRRAFCVPTRKQCVKRGYFERVNERFRFKDGIMTDNEYELD